MRFKTLAHGGVSESNEGDPGRAPTPFLIDTEALSRRCRQVNARLEWRNSVFAAARKMLTEDGHRHFTLRRLSIQTNSSVQNIFNNIGTKHDVVLQALINYNQILLTGFGGEFCNPYARLINARHKEVVDHPEYAK